MRVDAVRVSAVLDGAEGCVLACSEPASGQVRVSQVHVDVYPAGGIRPRTALQVSLGGYRVKRDGVTRLASHSVGTVLLSQLEDGSWVERRTGRRVPGPLASSVDVLVDAALGVPAGVEVGR